MNLPFPSSRVPFSLKRSMPLGSSEARWMCSGVLLAAVLLLGGNDRAAASTYTWSGAGTTWQGSTDWTPNTPIGGPTSTDTAEFNSTFSNQPTLGTTAGAAGSVWATTGLGQDVTVGGTGTLTIAGNQTVNGFTNTAILLDDAGNHNLTFNAPVATTSATSFIVNNSGTLSLTGGLTMGGALTLGNAADSQQGTISINSATSTTQAITVVSRGTVDIGGFTATSGGFNLNGTGTVNITGPVTTTGATAENAGTTFLTGAYTAGRLFVANSTLVIGTGGSVNTVAGGSSNDFQINGGGKLIDTAANSILDQNSGTTIFKVQSAGSAYFGVANVVNSTFPSITQVGGAAYDGSYLTLGNGAAVNTGTLEMAGGALLATAPMTIATPLALLNGRIEGTNAITFSGSVVNGTAGARVLGVNDSGGVTFAGGSINAASSINFYGTGPIAINESVSGATNGLGYAGTGTLMLDAVNTYGGGTTIAGNGMLELNFAATGLSAGTTNIISNSSVLTSDGATLNVNGFGSGSNSQAFLSTGTTTFGGGNTVIALNQNGNSSLTLDLSNTIKRNAGATLNISNNTLNTTTTVVNGGFTDDPSGAILGAWATVGSGTGLQYATVDGSGNVLAYGGATTASANLSNMTSGTTNYTFSTSQAITASAALSGDTLRYTGAAGAVTFGTGSSLTLNGLMNAGTGALTVGSTSAPTGTINIGSNNLGSTKELDITSNTQGITINSVIAGSAGSVAYNGQGTLSLDAANTFTGGFYLNSGTVNIQNNAAFGTTGTLTIAGGTLKSSGLANISVPETWAESFAFGGSNSSTLTLSGTVTMSQPTIGSGAPITLTMAGGSSDALAVTGTIVGSSYGLNVTGSGGTLVLSGSNTFSGPLLINNGASVSVNNVDKAVLLTMSGGISTSNTFTVTSTAGLFVGENVSGTNIPAGATITGTLAGNIVQISANLGGAASGSGTFFSNNPLGIGNFGNGGLVLDNGTLTYTGVAESTDRLFEVGTTTNGGSATLNASGSGAINFFSTGDVTYGALGTSAMAETRTLTLGGTNTGTNTLAALISNNGYDSSNSGNANVTLVKSGAGEWVISNTNNSYLGGTIINQGTLMNGANNALSQSGSITLGSTGNSATWNLNGFNQTVNSLATAGTAGNQTITNSATGASVLTYNGGTSTFGGVISDSGAGKTLGVTMAGGNLTLSGTNTYIGATTVSSGTLNVTGSLASGSAVTVGGQSGFNTPAFLTGTGTINGSLTTSSANGSVGHIAPGAPGAGNVGTLAVGGTGITVTLGAGTAIDFDLASATTAGSGVNDLISMNGGTLSIGGTSLNPILVNVNALGTLSTSGTYTLISGATTITGFNASDFQAMNIGSDTATFTENATDTAILLSFIAPSSSTSYYFTGAGSNDFTVAGNYNTLASGGTVQATALSSTSNVFLNATSPTPTNTPATLNAAASINSLNFVTGGTSLAGSGTVTLAATGTAGITDSAGVNGDTETVAPAVVLGSNQSWAATANSTLNVTGPISGPQNLTLTGAGTYKFGGSNTIQGLTVGTGSDTPTLFLTNGSSGSATGTTSLTVNAGATLGGNGTSSGTSFAITGTSTSARANVLVGLTSATDTTTTNVLTLKGTSASTIADANLTFNLDATSTASTQLAVGNTAIAFGTDAGSVKLTLNLQGEPAIVGAYTTYTLIAGTSSSDQYTGLTLGNTTTIAPGVTETIIGGNNLQLAFGSALDQSYYGANSYLVLYQAAGMDDIDVVVVPEPGTWALMLGGLAVLVFWQRRKNRQS